MNTPAWIAFGAAGLFAVLDWLAIVRGARRGEYLAKPATLVALTGAALLIDPSDQAQRAWFAVALVFSLAGDVFLMLPSDRFVPGLACFLVGHLAYIVGLNVDGGSAGALALSAMGLAFVAVPLGRRIVRGAVAHDRRLGAPVTLYIVAISGMVASAFATGAPWAIAGASLFYGSDAFIGWSRFVGAFPGYRLAIIVTYHVGQAALVASLVA